MASPTEIAQTRPRIWVFLNDRFAGTLELRFAPGHSEPTTSSFAYAPDYITSPAARPLSPELPLKRSPQRSGFAQPMFGAFADAAPDRWGRTLIWESIRQEAQRQGSGLPTVTAATYLVNVNDRARLGDLRFAMIPPTQKGATTPSVSTLTGSGVPLLTDLDRLLAAVTDFTQATNSDPRIDRLLVTGGTEMGGARPKAVVSLEDGALAMAKFPHPDDRWNVELWEEITARLARTAGIHTPHTRLIQLDADKAIFLSHRFDRDSNGGRLGYWSARTITMPPFDDPLSYTVFAERLAETVTEPRAQLHELFRRIAFTLLVNNVDDHLRNHALIYNGSWALSPAFDVNPHVGPPVPSTPILEGGERMQRTAADLIQAADWFEFTHDEALATLHSVERATASWRDIAIAVGADPDTLDFFAKAFDSPVRDEIQALHS